MLCGGNYTQLVNKAACIRCIPFESVFSLVLKIELLRSEFLSASAGLLNEFIFHLLKINEISEVIIYQFFDQMEE